MSEDLNNLPIPEEITLEAPVEEQERIIDEAPDPDKLRSEVEELEAKRQKAEEDAIYWRKQKAEARAEYFKGRDETPPPKTVATNEPKAEDFDNYDKYVAALVDHRTQVARKQWEDDLARKESERSELDRRSTLQAKLQEGYKKYTDFEEVAFDRTASHITPMIVDILTDCENPADVAYYLAKNRTEGVSISRMTPVQAARAIARLEIKLSTEPTKPKPIITGAPPPIKPVGSGNSGISKDPDKMTQKEYNDWRATQGARKF